MRSVALAITFGLLLAAPARAAVPSPATIDDKGVSDWLKTYIHWQGWTIIAADKQAVALGSPDGVAQLADGMIRAQIRREYYQDADIGGPARSILMTWLVDCPGVRIRVVEMSLFADSNLSGAVRSLNNPQAAWLPVTPDSQNRQVVARICEAPTTGKKLN